MNLAQTGKGRAASGRLFERLRHLAQPAFHCSKTTAECPVEALRASLARESELLRQKDALLQDRELMRQESDHRILNGLQVIVSMLRLQGSSATNPEVTAQLSVAANRVAAIERMHRRLCAQEASDTILLNKYLTDICMDFAALSTSANVPALGIAAETGRIEITSATALPLGFIVSELLTNAIKYGDGHIAVGLAAAPAGRYALTVSNDGLALPDGFDPARCKGLGMKIISALVRKIGGEFQCGPGADGQGAKFVVLFS